MTARLTASLILAAFAVFAETPLPQLRVEPTNGGSILFVKNISAQPLTAFLIELVDYPGSGFTLYQDDVYLQPLAPGVERRIPIVNMTVGAVPDYVKLQAAVYSDGATAGVAGKIAQVLERRKTLRQTTRELIKRLEGSQASTTALKEWAASLPTLSRSERNGQAGVNQAAVKGLISEAASMLEKRPAGEVIGVLREREALLASSKPALP